MPIRYFKTKASLRDMVSVEDAEPLLAWAQLAAPQAKPAIAVDLARCTHIHPAALQVLMAAQATVTAWPADPALAQWLRTALLPEPQDMP